MNSIFRLSFVGVAILAVAGCAVLSPPKQSPPSNTASSKPPKNATTAEQFDTTSQAERTAALAVPKPAGERNLGKTIATLGNPTDPGFWLETPLVSKRTQGRVVFASTGKSVAVELIPVQGAATSGSRISLPAMRLLGAPLAGLPELTVFAD
ncbi:MAG: D-galactarate dehydratase [Marinosulfonomonas sp.]|nr:D-galactarate dehydratase [Marinosulfonomonas sp.]